MSVCNQMHIKRTEDGWELAAPKDALLGKGRDYHIRYESDRPDPDCGWVLDVFDSTQDDHDKAHIETTDHKDITDALHAAFDDAEAVGLIL